MTGLTPGTTYYVRAYASNSVGTAYGDVIKFTTPSSTATPAAVTTFAGNGTGGFVNGTGTAAQLWNPQAVAADAQGNLYVADQFNHVIRKITSTGVVSTFCGNGTIGHVDGPAATAEFYSPAAIAVDTQGNVYVADQGSNDIIKISSAGVATTIAGIEAAGYINSTTGTKAAFNNPRGIAVDGQGNIYVADAGNHRIRKITAAGVVTTLAGNGYAGAVDSDGADAEFNQPYGLAINSKGVLYVADYNNHLIRSVASDGTVTSYVGNYYESSFLGNPAGIAFDSNDNLYISDATGRILKFNGTVLYTVAGAINTTNFADGAGTAAQFNSPLGLTVVQGNVFVADYNNNRIRKITGIQ
jgi:sugar lactone lactonase YvrE